MFTDMIGHEIILCYGFIRRDLGTGLIPLPVFTTASLLYRNAPKTDYFTKIILSFIYALLYLYSFVVANQIHGIEEDRVNKPDRPIVSNSVTVKAAKIRYVFLTIIYMVYGYWNNTEIWTVLWICTTVAHNFLGFSDFGPTKDMCMASGTIAQLMAAWIIGGSDTKVGWDWSKYIAIYMLWPISVQDLRDVPGDIATGRYTMPIILGDIPARVYISIGIFISQFLFIKDRILYFNHDSLAMVLGVILGVMNFALILRLFAFRSIESDKVSYRLYTVNYLLHPISAACVHYLQLPQ